MPISEDTFKGKTAVVTGATVGIGLVIAETLAQAGASVVLADLSNGASIADTFTAKGWKAVGADVDVRDQASVQAVFALAMERFGRVDIMVNNAGWSKNSDPLLELGPDIWDHYMAVNVRGTLFGMQEAAKAMIAGGEGGRIINIASTAAFKQYVGRAHYCTSKAAVVTLTRCGALELAQHGITVNAVAPGPTATETFLALAEGSGSPEEGEQMRARMARIPLGINTPADIANAVAYFASPENGRITGQTLVAEGGGSLL